MSQMNNDTNHVRELVQGRRSGGGGGGNWRLRKVVEAEIGGLLIIKLGHLIKLDAIHHHRKTDDQ